VIYSFIVVPAVTHRFVAREQIWPNPGFQEQLILFELCQYAPSPSNGIYVSWRQKIERKLKEQQSQR
jgi:dual specificity phosphatase 12